MSEDFRKWIENVDIETPMIEAKVKLLENYGASVERVDDREVGALNYKVQFRFEDDAVTSVYIRLKDHQSKSDLVFTLMTTLPDAMKSKGYGSEAIKRIIEWAKENDLKTIRAVQVANPESQKFWEKMGLKELKSRIQPETIFTSRQKNNL